jgi:hypothetical protein
MKLLITGMLLLAAVSAFAADRCVLTELFGTTS